jgi:hypothetical protein
MIKSDLNEKWRQRTDYLKASEFDLSKTIEEVVAALHDVRVDEVQYRKLLEFWFSKKAQVSHTYYKIH